MKNTLRIINELMQSGVIRKYAIAGGMAQFYYIEPSATYDLDIIVHTDCGENSLEPLKSIYDWARKKKYKIDREHIIIEGIPVQFLPAYNELVNEALENAVEINIFQEKSYTLKAEYLMAIMLQTGRMKDKERFIRFLQEAEFNKLFLEQLIKKFNLENNYRKYLNDV